MDKPLSISGKAASLVMKNIRQELLRQISTALKKRNKVPFGWHYHILAIEGSNGGLASYLQMTNDEWKNVMLLCGLVKRVGENYG